jgi:Restriction endonuclease
MNDRYDVLQRLNWQDFELLVLVLLAAEGYRLVNRAKPGARGPDVEAISPAGEYTFIEIKNYSRGSMGQALLHEFASDVHRYQLQFPNARGLLIFSGDISAPGLEAIASLPRLEVWGGADLYARLAKHPTVAKAYEEFVLARERLEDIARSFITQDVPPSYVTKLADVPKGRGGWRDYELLCAEILTKIFSPALGPPDLQERSDDGLDIMDAIFPIRAVTAPWSLIRSEYNTRFVVAEFKNYTDPIGQKEVESVAQYLWHKAQRNFGIIVTRVQPSGSALAQRRRKWLEENKMIVVLTDDDLAEMLQLFQAKRNPFNVIDAHLEEFLRTLSP